MHASDDWDERRGADTRPDFIFCEGSDSRPGCDKWLCNCDVNGFKDGGGSCANKSGATVTAGPHYNASSLSTFSAQLKPLCTHCQTVHMQPPTTPDSQATKLLSPLAQVLSS